MAGAGPNIEKLKEIVVPSMLSEGGRFLKWDDNDVSLYLPYILEVDPNGHVLYWRPEDFSKDTEVLELVHLRDVRTGQYAKMIKSQDLRAREMLRLFCAFEHEANCIQERTITICYGPNFVDVTFVNFVASSISEAEEWSKALLGCTRNLLEINASPLRCLERFYTKIIVQKKQDGEIPAKLLVKNFASNKDDKKKAYDTLQSLGLSAGKKDTIKVKDFTFQKFLSFHNTLVTRQDIDIVFAEQGAKKKPYLTLEQLVQFLNNHQRDPRLNEILFPYYNNDRAQALINAHEPNKDFASKGYISIDGLTSYLMSSDNPILLPGLINVHQDMTFPIAHYFINSSHNTYLSGHQFTGKSSVEIYRQVLLAGCRCIELDCWDGRKEECEPIITHGNTLCTEILFKDVLEAIKESAFKMTDMPLILSFENHCTAKQQQKMANYCLQIFGDLLLNKPLDDYPLDCGQALPSPTVLRGKILIKNKKKKVNPPPVVDTKSGADLVNQSSLESTISSSLPSETTVLDENNEDADTGKEIVLKSEEEEQPEVEAQEELSDLVNYFQPVHFRGFDRAEKVKRFYEMSSFSENAAMNLLKESPVEFVNYNKFQPSRIYPKASRVGSDNYMPQMFWNAGCQFVALNFQTLDLPMMLNQGKFEINGGCGFLLKPEHMRRSDRTFDPFVDTTVDGIIAGTVQVRVISGQCLSERRCGTYVEVEMYGLPADTVRRKYRTKVVSNNGLNPVYDEDPYKFKVILPHLAELRIAAYEDNGKLIGHRVLPVTGLSAGYRHIKLRNDCYQPLCLPTLFVDIVTKDYVPENFSDFADALANPMKYLSEKEKRTQQLEALLIDDQADSENDSKNDLSIPSPTALEIKRGSIVSVPVPNEILKKDNVGGKASDAKNSNRSQSWQITNSSSIDHTSTTQRSMSVTPSDSSSSLKDEYDLKPPTIDTLLQHKLFAKFKQKCDAELQLLVQKHSKDFMKILKDVQMATKKMRMTLDQEKSSIQKRHSKILKKAESDGTYNTTYNDCIKEINELNTKHEAEMKRLEDEQQRKSKELFRSYYNEQLDVAKSHIEPKVLELRKIVQVCELSDQKKLNENHKRSEIQLKKDQDRFSRSEMKDIVRRCKDKSELQEEKKAHNRKHIEQSVKERQKLKAYQESEKSDLAKQYEELVNSLDDMILQDSRALEETYQLKIRNLEILDFNTAAPTLLP